MKTAREHIEGYESRVREYTNFTVRGVKRVCKDCGPREPGSDAERKAQKMMAKEMESCCESVTLEPYTLAPRAFFAWITLGVCLTLLAAAMFNLGYALAGLLLLVITIAAVVFEFLLYKPVLDVFYPKKTSQNMVAVRKPSGETKRRLILCGHADSAYEWPYAYYGHKYLKTTKLLAVVIATALVTILFGFGVCLSAVIVERGGRGGIASLDFRPEWLRILGYVFAGLCLPLLSGLGYKNARRVVMGANDNLTGCYTAMAIAKLMGGLDLRLENTELVVLCAGGEESGLRGAKAFAKAHAEEYKDAETVFIALDTIRDFDHMGIYISDLTGTVKHDPAVCNLIRSGGKAAGFDLPFMPLYFGGSDAAAATQKGMRASCFVAMDPAPAYYYHTRLDNADILEPKTVEATLKILMETVYQFDAEGLAPFEGLTAKVGQ